LPSYATLYFHTPHALSHISCPTLHCSLLPSFFRFLRDHLDLPSFPTRRSSDLNTGPGAGVEGCPAHSEITSPCVSRRRAAAARTLMTWNGSTAERWEGSRGEVMPRR